MNAREKIRFRGDFLNGMSLNKLSKKYGLSMRRATDLAIQYGYIKKKLVPAL